MALKGLISLGRPDLGNDDDADEADDDEAKAEGLRCWARAGGLEVSTKPSRASLKGF